MDYLKQVFSFKDSDQNVETITVKEGSIEYYIDKVQQQAGNPNSPQFLSAIINFKNAVAQKYNELEELNDSSYFLNELFSIISISCLDLTTYLSLIVALIKVNLGDNVAKASRIARDIINITPDSNERTSELLHRVLLYVSHVLGTSSQLIFQPLLGNVLKWVKTSNVNAGYRLFLILYQLFPNMMESYQSNAQTVICYSLQLQSPEIMKIVQKILKIAFKNQDSNAMDLMILNTKIMVQLTGTIWKYYEGSIKCAEIIIKYNPSLIDKFKFKELHLKYLASKDNEAKVAYLSLIPFVYKTTPELFTEDIMTQLFKLVVPLCKKRSDLRNEAMLSLGKIIFLNTEKVSFLHKELSNLISYTKDLVNSGEAVFLLAALTAADVFKFESFLNYAFSIPPSTRIVKAIKRLAEACSPYKYDLFNRYIITISKTLEDDSSSDEDIIFMFNSIKKLNISHNFIQLPIVIAYSRHLYHESLSVRKTCLNFLLNYQNEYSSIEITYRIIAFVSTEIDDDLRGTVFARLKTDIRDPSLSKVLAPLIRDPSPDVALGALKYLVKLANDPDVLLYLTNFINELIQGSKRGINLSTTHKMFLILAQESDNCIQLGQLMNSLAAEIVDGLMNDATRKSTAVLMLLSLLIPLVPNSVSISELAQIIDNGLSIHSSAKKLSATVDLMRCALESTQLGNTIYNQHVFLIQHLLNASSRVASQNCRDKILKVLSLIGPVENPLHKTESKIRSPTVAFLNDYEELDPLQRAEKASVSIVLTLILDVLANDDMIALHHTSIDAMVSLFKTEHEITPEITKKIVERIGIILKSNNIQLINVIFSNIRPFISVLESNFEPLIPIIVDIIINFWDKFDSSILLRTCEWILFILPDAFSPYINRLCVHLCNVLSAKDVKTTTLIIATLIRFGKHIESSGSIVVKTILKLIKQISYQESICGNIIKSLSKIIVACNPAKFYVPVVQCMVEILHSHPGLNEPAMKLILIVAFYYGKHFLFQVPQLSKVIDLESDPLMSELISSFKNNKPVSQRIIKICSEFQNDELAQTLLKTKPRLSTEEPSQIKFRLPAANSDKSSWYGWSQDFFHTIIKNSRSKAISACTLLAEKHTYIKEVLSPIAFIVFYISSTNPKKSKIIEMALKEENTPKEIVKVFLTVTELLEVVGIQVPTSLPDIINAANKTDQTANALRAAEVKFDNGDNSVAKLLIDLNTKLNLPKSAKGVLKQAIDYKINVDMSEASEKVGLWNEALQLYDTQIKEGNEGLIDSKMRCLNALNRFSEMEQADGETKAVALLHLAKKDEFIECMKNLKSDSIRADILRAFVCVASKNEKEFTVFEDRIRKEIVNKIFPIISEDYNNAYDLLLNASVLQILSEGMTYVKTQELLKSATVIERTNAQSKLACIEDEWKTRFAHIPDDPRRMHNFLMAIIVAAKPIKFVEEITRCAQLAINTKNIEIAESCISLLEHSNNDSNTQILRAKALHLKGEKEKSMEMILSVAENEKEDINIRAKAEAVATDWFREDKNTEESITHAKAAIKLSYDMVNAHYSLAISNYHLFSETGSKENLINSFEEMAISLTLSKTSSYVYTLKILTTLFRTPCPEIFTIFRKYMNDIPTHTWIDVIPQVLSRANSDDAELRKVIVELMVHVGKDHPHLVLYSIMPLLTCDGFRKDVATDIYQQIKASSPKLTETMSMFSTELVRIAVSWFELYISTIELNSNLTDTEVIIQNTRQLLELMNSEPKTYFEVSFKNAFGSQISNALEMLERYNNERTEERKSAFWATTSLIYKQVKKFSSEFSTIDLIDVAPKLAKGPIDLSVPGTYALRQELITISSISPKVVVMNSKQKPRKIKVYGSNGVEYLFLLKGHEDTRLDERVMQLFKFLNSQFKSNKNLRVTTYKVTPLTRDVGLIGWLPGCTTMFELVKNYRTYHHIPIEAEYEEASKGQANYDTLPLSQKVFAYRRGLRVTQGNDLKHVLFTHSADTNHWIERRSIYTASLASTSLFGYILGLGDRHTANIMVNEVSSKLVHIDFGDCFEVAQHRKKFPEKVPFRLTRMMVNTLEPAGVNGSFHELCIELLSEMREKKVQVVGLLEAFVYDPLIQWINVDEGIANDILKRIEGKLEGRDYDCDMDVKEHVDRLIKEATSIDNLCQMYRGWFAFW